MSYLGSKGASGVYQQIIAAMPPHDVYIETHLGGGKIMKSKPPAAHQVGIDIDPAVAELHEPLHANNFELIIGDAVDYLEACNFTMPERVLIYCDPPYLMSTRTSSHRYKYEYTEADHLRLLQCLVKMTNRSGVNIIISGYPSALYDTWLEGWRSVEFQAMTRGGVRTEKLWMNYQQTAAHWSRYAGANFTDRQRIKRKAARWQKNYRKLPPGERLAIMAALMEVDAGTT